MSVYEATDGPNSGNLRPQVDAAIRGAAAGVQGHGATPRPRSPPFPSGLPFALSAAARPAVQIHVLDPRESKPVRSLQCHKRGTKVGHAPRGAPLNTRDTLSPWSTSNDPKIRPRFHTALLR